MKTEIGNLQFGLLIKNCGQRESKHLIELLADRRWKRFEQRRIYSRKIAITRLMRSASDVRRTLYERFV